MDRSASAEPRKLPRQRRSAETVERILDAAARIFDERGYRATTTNGVAQEAGVSIGSLYQYFPNKDALLVALAERHLDDVTGRFDDRLRSLRASQPQLDDTVRALLTMTVELNDTSRLHALLHSDCPRTPALAERLDRFTDVLVAEVAWHLERTGSGGPDPTLRARLVVAAVDAAAHEVVLAESPGSRRDAATDELVALTVRALAATRPSRAAARGGARPTPRR